MKKFLLVFIGIAIGLGTYAGRDDSAPTQQEIDNELQKLKSNMVLVEGGTFGMGVAAHETTVASFYISKYEVTQGLWRAVMGKLGYFDGSTRDDQLPLENRSWDTCQQFISKLNEMTGEEYYMPTEAEWEFAARGGNKSQGYIYAGSNNLEEVAEWPATGKSRVGTKKPNELGLYDMTGNLAEWVADGESDELKAATRGGSYESPKDLLQVTCRGTGFYKSTSSYLIGLRLAKKATQQPAKRRPFFISYNKGGEEQQATVNGIRFIPSQYGKEAYAWQPADDEWQSYTSLAADGFDIQNVRSISRTRIELTESKGEELQQALKEEAQSGTADVNAIVAALQDNPNVADAQTDSINVMVREEGDSVYTVYPMIQLEDPFLTDELKVLAARLRKELSQQHKTSSKENESKKVAIFNYFADIDKRAGQNAIVEGIRDLFIKYEYTVEYYDNNELDFTKANIEKVVAEAHNKGTYKAIFIFSHGFIGKDNRIPTEQNSGVGYSKSFYVTREEYNPNLNINHGDNVDEHHYKVLCWDIGDYYNTALPVDELKVGRNCLLYVGSCHAFDQTTILTNEPWIGWTGTNSLAQAHAAIMVSRMLDHTMTASQALSGIWMADGANLIKYNPIINDGFSLNNNHKVDLDKPIIGITTIEINTPSISATKVLTSQKETTEFDIRGCMQGQLHNYFFIELVPLHNNGKTYEYEFHPDKDGRFSQSIRLPAKLRGIYELRASCYMNKKKAKDRRYIRLTKPIYLACSDAFKDNDAVVLKPAKKSKIVMTTAKTPGEQLEFGYYYDKDVWFDMNNNGVREWGEYPDWETLDYTTFRPTVQSQTFTIYGDLREYFDCGSDNFEHNYNRLTSIDMSEYYGDLKGISCAYNELTKLVLPKGTPLSYVWASNNKLAEIDASGLYFLETLMLSNNQLTSVKLPESYTLYNLDIQSNKSLKAIDVSELPNLMALHCQNCVIEQLYVNNNPELTELLCDGNRLTTLDLSANQNLLALGCNYNQLNKEALESIYRQVPDISGNIDSLEYKLWLPQLFRMLRANGNPGFYEADQSIATKKGWEFEDKWTGYSRRSRRTPLGNGGTNSK